MEHREIEFYIRSLLEIATALEQHQEARSAFAPAFLSRIVQDGFLQTMTGRDTHRILQQSRPDEEFLLWQGRAIPSAQKSWNSIGWILPFATPEELEQSYEQIIRAELARKPWGAVRQWWLSCRLRFQESPFEVPTNLVKVRVGGGDCNAAMTYLEQHPPNLRYIVKILLERLPASSSLRKRLHLKLVVGEKLEPYISTSQAWEGRENGNRHAKRANNV